jgi:hypothetical protein
MVAEFIFIPNLFVQKLQRRYLQVTMMIMMLKAQIKMNQQRSHRAIEMSRIPKMRLVAQNHVSAVGRSQQAW